MQIGIIGLGLIGGSLGLALKQNTKYQVLGVSRNPLTCQTAIARKIADQTSIDPIILQNCDLIFICTPIDHIIPTIQRLIPHLNPDTTITDVGSVKTSIVEAIAPLWTNFIGGHPMAGTAESGIDAAQLDLFVNQPYILTPIPETPAIAQQKLTTIINTLQSQLYITDPATHDRAVSWISHLPIIISANLIKAVLADSDPNIITLAQQIASSGFKDTSRVGGGNPELGVMIAKSNRTQLLKTLTSYQDSLDQLINHIQNENWIELEQQLKITQENRPKFVR